MYIQRCENRTSTADENVNSITKKLLSEKADKIDESEIQKMIDLRDLFKRSSKKI